MTHLEHLLFYGADMNAQNASGNTPLHVCAVNNQVRVDPADPMVLIAPEPGTCLEFISLGLNVLHG